MPIDTSIYGNIKPVQIQSPVNMLSQAMQLKGAQSQNRLADLLYGAKQREIEQTEGFNALYKGAVRPDGTIDQAKLVKSAAEGGYGSRIPDLYKTFASQDKTQREAEKARMEAAKTQVELIGQVAGAAKDPQSYAQGLQILKSAGVDVSTIPEQYDPSYVEQARAQAMTASQQLDQMWKQKGFDLDTAKFDYQQRNDEANRNTTIRGQNLTDARGREANDIQRQVAGMKPPTEFQGRSAAFGARAEEADRLLNDLAGKYSPAAINAKTSVESTPLVGGMLGAATNMMALSDADQKAEQAQRDFVNAVLRQESGAVISPEEFINATKQYFPQPGDSKAVIEQKAHNRSVTIEGLKQNAGRHAFSSPAPTNQTADGWSIVEVE